MRVSLITKYRNILLGISTLLIVVCHAAFFVDNPLLKYFFTLGNYGVPIFSFLSGVGIYFSTQKNTPVTFYKNRVNRFLIPYLLIGGVFYAISYFIVTFQPLEFIYGLSTVKFWVKGDNNWFIAMLIPLYAVSPWYAKWLSKGKRGLKTTITIIILITIWIVFYYCFPTYLRVKTIINSIMFFIGFYFGECAQNDKKIPVWFLVSIPIIFVIQAMVWKLAIGTKTDFFYFIGTLYESLMGITGMCVLVLIIDLTYKYLKTIYEFVIVIGSFSLESYLINIYLSGVYRWLMWDLGVLPTTQPLQCIFYFIFVGILGIVISWFVHKLALLIEQ